MADNENLEYEDSFANDEYVKKTFTDEEERIKMVSLFDDFRTEIYDCCPEKNILDDKKNVADARHVHRYFKRAVRDLNAGSPITNYTLVNFPDTGLLVEGAVVFFLIANGLLQLRNQLNYNDAGLTINMFDKSAMYQSWVQMLYSMYLQGKKSFKNSEITRSYGAGFYGIGSEFGLMAGDWWDELY